MRIHHFAHYKHSDCKHGYETAIHLAAKQIIMERKQITFPACISSARAKDSKGVEHAEQETVVCDGKTIHFHTIQEEIELHGMKADILATHGDTPLIIEIFYRHKVDDQKMLKIVEANVSAIEIDLSDLTPDDIKNWDTFWSSINNPKRIKWLYNAKAHDTVYRRLESKLEKKIQAQEKRYKQEEIEKHRREEKEKAQLLQVLDDFKTLYSEEHIEKLKKNAEAHPAWKHTRQYLSFSWNELPDFLNADVPNGDWIFGCDRRIWQAAFYSFFIGKMGGSFSVQMIDDWLQNKVGFKVPRSAKTVGMFGRRYPQLLPAELSYDLPSSWGTLKTYFRHLCTLGMLEYTGEDWKHPGSHWFRVISKKPVSGSPKIPVLIQNMPEQALQSEKSTNIGQIEGKSIAKKYYLKNSR